MPTSDTLQELAAFGQDHETTDFEDEPEEVPGPVFDQAQVVDISLTGDERQAMKPAAGSRGIDEVALIHEWVREGLDRL